MKSLSGVLALCLSVATAFIAPAFMAPAVADNKRLENAGSEPGNWLLHGRTYSETRESPLTQINPDNINRLGLAWYFETGTKRGLEATPIVVDGKMYTTGSWSMMFAHDAKTGELLWKYDPEVPRSWGVNACCDVVNRGPAVEGDRVFFGTIDGRLIALNRFTGEKLWETLTIDPTKPYTITGAPRVIHDTVIIGNGGAEYGVRGYITAYDVATGESRWRFYTVPGDPALPAESPAIEMAAKTWTGDVFYKVGGGGTVWDSMAYDPELDLLYIGVGNGSPWNRHIRSPGGGDNLFLSSIVAIRGKTGEYVWHYQTTPADTWDYTATQHMILADLDIHGLTRKVIMQAPKNGFFYVLDRTTGEFLSAGMYTPITWASHVDPETGRPVETENADHRFQTQLTKPAPFGGHNWQPMAFNEENRLVYIPAMENMSPYSTQEDFEYVEGGHWNLGQGGNDQMPIGGDPDLMMAMLRHMMRGRLLAWDPVEQKEVWRIEHPTAWNGGVLTTKANLVFQGNGQGHLVAYKGDTGEKVWDYDVGNGIIAPPISFELDGEQYIAVMAGWGGAIALTFSQPEAVGGGPGRLLVFKLDGKETLPKIVRTRVMPEPPARSEDEASVERGMELYGVHCMRCHGVNVTSDGVVADLRYLSEGSHKVFQNIVYDGIFSNLGMVGFSDVLSRDDVDDIHNYIIDAANNHYENEQAPDWWRNTKQWVYDKIGEAASWLM